MSPILETVSEFATEPHGALLVADLHFEKASWYARFGQFLPPHDSQATLDVIEALVARTGARAVWSLGDSFHDADGAARLDPQARARLDALTQRLDWTWITGNHDGSVANSDTVSKIGLMYCQGQLR
jgi:metallophosphoesterase superfamily enzyme